MNRRQIILSFMTLITFLSLPMEGKDDDKSKGGGGRGGDRGKGSHHSGRSEGHRGRSNTGGERSIQRNPSINRPSHQSRPNVSAPQRQGNTPQKQRQNVSRPQGDRSHHHSHSSSEGRAQTRNQVQQFIKNSAPSRHQHGNKDRDHGRQDGKFRNEGKHIRDQVGSHYHHRNHWFNKHFWDRHHYHPQYYNYNDDWWIPATAVGIGSWLGWQDQPYYYDSYDEFGYADYPSVSYEDSYSVQPQAIPKMPLSDEWMPLGVFAVATNGRSLTTPSMFIQLALKKNGEIAGTYYNAILEQNYELEGMVNPDSQLVAWKISNNLESPVFQTGIYNLSQEEVPIRVYFQNNTTQDWLLVRIEN